VLLGGIIAWSVACVLPFPYGLWSAQKTELTLTVLCLTLASTLDWIIYL